MSFKVAVCYGQPDDPEAFDAYYRDTHMPLARKIPGLTDFTWGNAAPSTADSRRTTRSRASSSPTPTP